MDKYSDVKIKELIKQFPKIVDVLEEYQIDCVHCKKGTCRLRDIVEAENLSMDEEMGLVEKISGVLS
jgi:iron-sulfur cluster repair protein YtfE (RIC family)